jgi:dipeptidyl aminopeptidase/acylaminoacyl peptidase
MVAAQGVRLGAPNLDGEDIYWLEGRPAEGGRSVLVRRTPDGRISDVTDPPFNVRSRVHEYGGGAYAVSRGTAYFSNFADGRLYRASTIDGSPPTALTADGEWYFADAVIDHARGRLICVREDHSVKGKEAINTLVSISTDGSPLTGGEVIASGYDFYSTPRLSPDGRRLCWICWRHPNMPWDGTELWVADVTAEGALEHARRVAGGPTESIYQPGWGPEGSLYFASDRDGWWRLYRYESEVTPVLASPPSRAEFGRPEWVFGTSTWTMAAANLMVASYTRDGRWRLAGIRLDQGSGGRGDLPTGTLNEVPMDLEPFEWVKATPTHAVIVAASPTQPEAVVRVGLESGSIEVLRSSQSQTDHEGLSCYSTPEPVEFPTRSGGTAHAFYYPPFNRECIGPEGERPPLIVITHGGPTTATRDTLDLRVQYWTSRGFAIADVNYSGSSGYGREYRDRLKGQWGVSDVAEVIDAAGFLVSAGKADPQRLIIRGASAGGYTTLAALAFHPDVFTAGASYYGIADLEVLARDTHKFESRYLDSLIGPYPAMRDTYRARSPIHFVDRLSCALILFQGLEDQVVPPNQSEMMAAAVRARGLPVAYLTFAGEQHGFRRAETIVRSLEAELAFYREVFRFAEQMP